MRRVENLPYEGGPKPLFGRGVIREVFHPPLFSTPPWRPLINAPSFVYIPPPCETAQKADLTFQGAWVAV